MCDQILRQMEAPMKRRNDSNLLVIKSQIESVKENEIEIGEKITICNQLLRQLDLPMRRCDDWNLSIIKEKVKMILQELKEDS